MKQILPVLALAFFASQNVPAQIWTSVEMPKALYGAAYATNGNKVFIVGGCTGSTLNANDVSDKIYTYDVVTGEWEAFPLSNPRHSMPGIAVGGKLLFAGGSDGYNGSFHVNTTDTVDVYDTLTQTWSIAHLSVPVRTVTASVIGSKAYFAGGRLPNLQFTDRMDIYDAATDTWTIDTIPVKDNCNSGVAGNKLLLWASADCHILNTTTGEWTTHSFVNNRGWQRAVVSTPEEVWFIGGQGLLDTIDIYNIAEGTWNTRNTVIPRDDPAACLLNGKIIIAGGNDGTAVSSLVEIFDTKTGEWLELTELSEPKHWFTKGDRNVPVIGNSAYFPGGCKDMAQSQPSIIMDIYTDTSGTTSNLFTPVLKNVDIQAFPSPFSEALTVQVDFEKPTSGSLEMLDLAGRQVFLESIDNQAVWNKSIVTQGWATGAYLLKVRTRDGVAVQKIIKQ